MGSLECEKIEHAHQEWMYALDSFKDAIFLHDEDFRILRCNKAYQRYAGVPFEKIIGRKYFEIFPKSDAPIQSCLEGLKKRGSKEKEEEIQVGQTIFRSSSYSLMDKDGEYMYSVHTLEDITKRKEAEKALERAKRALMTLSAGNMSLVKATSEEELLHTVTSVIVEKGGYSLATVVYSQNDLEKSMSLMAWSGGNKHDFYDGRLSWDDIPEGQLPSARSIRNGTTQVCRDIENEPGYQLWKDACKSHLYASNIALPLLDSGKVFGSLSIYSCQDDSFDEEEIVLLEELASDLSYGIVNLRTRVEHEQHTLLLRESLEESIQAIAATLESRDPYTAGHQRRVAELATAIAQEMELPKDQVQSIHFAAIIHDLGKIHVPAEILVKPSRLNNLEYKLIQMHPQTGYDILKDIKFPWPIAQIILQHHEKIDGTGYPQGLKGDEILLEAKIVALADVVEAMSSHRPYRPSVGIKAAMDEIKQGSGSSYEPSVVDACLKLFSEKKFAFSSDF